jgi:aldehyde:ferredoxin oxidoreductase
MSTGVVLGWATEALEKGLISEKEHTLLPLRFGDSESYRTAIHHIAEVKNEFYRNLGMGVRHAAKVYGGEDFAMHIEGNEMSGYHTGYGSLVGMAVAARHSHLCNGGYALDQTLDKDKPLDPEWMAEALLSEEMERCMLNSLVMCLFARKVYDRETIKKAFSAIGKDYTDEDLNAVARRNYATKLRIKKALGFDWENMKLPKRFFETPSSNGILNEETANEILKQYRLKLAELETEA